jgi:hypothetical protein
MPFCKASYDGATVEMMGEAYDAVLADMKAAHGPLSSNAKTMIVRRILEAVADGERNLDWLILKGLEAANASR